ncbi:hypothetical protein B0T22DRAFT_452427 [Podospora appendiculata]|uniref:Secreted protein n=1 Tax=Podospora appendiculata TaxID=314037 RepID=A0AAE1CH36_9PEZI|nr:hypothetical protein B0T22DRAFT_452427 [Podospora appendiculata]
MSRTPQIVVFHLIIYSLCLQFSVGRTISYLSPRLCCQFQVALTGACGAPLSYLTTPAAQLMYLSTEQPVCTAKRDKQATIQRIRNKTAKHHCQI